MCPQCVDDLDRCLGDVPALVEDLDIAAQRLTRDGLGDPLAGHHGPHHATGDELLGLAGKHTAAHIHCCTATPEAGTAGVATQVPNFVGFPLGVTAGAYDFTFDLSAATSWNLAFITANGGSPASAEAALLAGLDSERAYLNIHTAQFPGGEIRGFLSRDVPEPAVPALLGMAAVAALASRRRP